MGINREWVKCRYCEWGTIGDRKGWRRLYMHVQYAHTKAEREGRGGEEKVVGSGEERDGVEDAAWAVELAVDPHVSGDEGRGECPREQEAGGENTRDEGGLGSLIWQGLPGFLLSVRQSWSVNAPGDRSLLHYPEPEERIPHERGLSDARGADRDDVEGDA